MSLDGSLVRSEKDTLTPNTTGVGEGSIDQSSTSWGLLGGGFGVGVSYGVSNNVLLATQLLISSSSIETKTKLPDGTVSDSLSSTADSSAVSLLPRVEYVFGDTGDVRPFVAGILGLTSSKATFQNGNVSQTLYSFGAGLGLHGFVSHHFSIDPLLSIHRVSGSQDVNANATATTSSSSFSSDVTGTLIALTVSFTGWFGGDVQPEPAAVSPNLAPPISESPAPAGEDRDGPDASGFAPIKTTLLLPGQHAIFIKGRPEAAPSSLLVRFAENPSSTALRECTEIRLVVGNRFYRVEHLALEGRRRISGQTRFVSEGVLPVRAIDAASRSDSAHFDICGTQWSFTPAVQEAFRDFLVQFRRRGGAPSELPAEPVASPPPVETPTPTGGTEAPPAPPGSSAPPVSGAPPAPPAPGTPPAPATPRTPAPAASPKAPATR